MVFSRSAGVSGFSSVPRVDLLPHSEIERRERAALVRRWLVGVLAAVVLVAALSAGAYAFNLLAHERLAAENARTTDLLARLSGLSDVSKTRAVQSDLEAYRAQAMGADVAWTPVLATIDGVIPHQGTITAWDLVTGALPGAGKPADEAGVTGRVSVQSPVPMDLVTMVRALRAEHGVIDADAADLTGTVAAGATGTTPGAKPTYTYQLTVTLDQTVYTGLYAAKEK